MAALTDKEKDFLFLITLAMPMITHAYNNILYFQY